MTSKQTNSEDVNQEQEVIKWVRPELVELTDDSAQGYGLVDPYDDAKNAS
jgi:hypothetical protein